MSPVGAKVDGVVLCLAGGHRLAVLAHDVGSVEVPDGAAPWAGRGFARPEAQPETGRLLRHGAASVVVDSLEVHAESLPLLPVPAALRALGDGLLGFVVAAGELWPVVSLGALSARLGGAR